MSVYSSLLNDDGKEVVRLPADIVQYIDEQRLDQNLSREDYIRAALHCSLQPKIQKQQNNSFIVKEVIYT